MADKKQIQIVNSLQLLGFIQKNGNGCRFVGITYKAPVEKIKVGHPFGQLFKVSKFQGWVNADYVEGIKTKLAGMLGVNKEEVSYETGKSSYVHPDGFPPCIVVKAKTPDDGVYYLQYRPDETKAESVYVNEKGEIIPTEKVKPWLQAKSKGKPWKPPVNALMLSRIVELRASGTIATTEEANEAKELLALQDSTIQVSLTDNQAAMQDSYQHTGGKPEIY